MNEAIIGQPQSLNPIFAPINNADRDVSELLFSGLLKYNSQGELVKDLAKKFEITNNGKTYKFTLRDDLQWSDGEKITAGDIVFTIESIKNSEVQSPHRLTFEDVELEKVDKSTVKFTLDSIYPPFVENFTLKILPKHIFKDTKSQNFSSKLKEDPVSSGPFKIEKIKETEEENPQIEEISLVRNEEYQFPVFLDKINLTFKDEEEEAISSQNNFTSLSTLSTDNLEKLSEEFDIRSFKVPRYFALFLNQENKILSDVKVRKALAWASPQQKILEKALDSKGRKINAPLLKEHDIGGDIQKYGFDKEKAKKKLKNASWKVGNEDNNIRKKKLNDEDNPTSLKLDLFTLKQSQLEKTASIIKENWNSIGAKVNVHVLNGDDLRQNHIKERDYDILLLGQSLTMKPDPSFFWHSSQTEYPGSNLSMYENSKVDEWLEKARKETNPKERKKVLRKFQSKITKDVPAIFLYSPNHLYPVKEKIKGIKESYIINSSKRFIGIENWYTNQKRVPKNKPESPPENNSDGEKDK